MSNSKPISKSKSIKSKKEGEKGENSSIDKDSASTKPDSPFDFGGLPTRNLKKNLGCG